MCLRVLLSLRFLFFLFAASHPFISPFILALVRLFLTFIFFSRFLSADLPPPPQEIYCIPRPSNKCSSLFAANIPFLYIRYHFVISSPPPHTLSNPRLCFLLPFISLVFRSVRYFIIQHSLVYQTLAFRQLYFTFSLTFLLLWLSSHQTPSDSPPSPVFPLFFSFIIFFFFATFIFPQPHHQHLP